MSSSVFNAGLRRYNRAHSVNGEHDRTLAETIFLRRPGLPRRQFLLYPFF
ncbi:hypothetical protein [Halomonas colorata]|uniref:Uncharacterized protein n=1 Tax=Halomonas colorata TaxID=2742615 RepID=A0ABR9FZJ4_9GAMM|nr:hypothetical protein [Halomonas colorata]MBE0464045.1 hypothetical protein [Halomonas colorata]